jgi:hypothetical protein
MISDHTYTILSQAISNASEYASGAKRKQLQSVYDWSRSSIVDTKSITLPAVARSIDVRKRPVKDSPVASGAAVGCRTLQCTR